MASPSPCDASLPGRALRSQNLRQEPRAVVPHAGICAGGRPQGRSLPRPDVPTVELVEQLRRANARLREVLAARDGELEALRVAMDAENAELRAVVHALTLQVAELQRRLGSGSDDSGTPSSKESIGAKARRKAEREARRQERGGSSRQRSADRSRGGQPGHPGHGLVRDPDPQHREELDPPTACRGCGGDLAGAADAGTSWSQILDVTVIRWCTEYLLPRRRCGCATITTAC